MARRKRAVCFIDDQDDELIRFRNVMGERFTVGTGTSLKDALEDLKTHGRSKPDLFLVDLYGSDGAHDVDDPVAYLNNARADLLVAETNFYKVLAELRQTSNFGFDIAHDIRNHHNQPIVIYTRKGTIDNAIQAYRDETINSVMKKPDPSPTISATAQGADLHLLYAEALVDRANEIESQIDAIIRDSTWWEQNRKVVGSFLIGVVPSLVVTLLLAF